MNGLLDIIARLGRLLGKIGAANRDARIREIDAAASEARKERMRKIDDELRKQKELEDEKNKRDIVSAGIRDRIDRADSIADMDDAIRGRR